MGDPHLVEFHPVSQAPHDFHSRLRLCLPPQWLGIVFSFAGAHTVVVLQRSPGGLPEHSLSRIDPLQETHDLWEQGQGKAAGRFVNCNAKGDGVGVGDVAVA